MSEKELVKKEILHEPSYYFAAQGKSLDARIDEINLSEEDEANITDGRTKKFIRDKALGLFKVGEIVLELLNWNESIDGDLREAKKEYLLAKYLKDNEKNTLAISQLKNFLSSAQGNTLFNKVLRILDDSPPDIELAGHLASALQHIVKNDFQKLFEQHKYALSQIERMTPQALTILSDHRNWPLIGLGSYSASGSKVTSDWLSEFTSAYTESKSIFDAETQNRVNHSINELISGRFIEAHLTGEKMAKCAVTKVGQSMLPYIGA